MNRIENIDFCIRYLMQQNNVEAEIPTTLAEKQRLLRALSNIWEPQPLSDEFLAAQDAELQAQLTDKGVVENVGELWQGDITRLQVDAIVNAANSQGLGCWHPLHACIDNAIHSAAGLIIPDGIPTPLQEEQLAACYRACLRLAEMNGCHSIAFCCISTGEFRFPNSRAAEIATNTVKQSHNNTIKVVFNVFKDIDYDIYSKLLGKN